jgi:hypothetical protein
MIAVGVAMAALLITAHCLMPVNRSWQFNRVLHYIWLGVTGLACAGGVAFILWPRAKLPRRDQERQRARDRIISLIIVVVGTFAIIAFGEVRRDRVCRTYLASAVEDMGALHGALAAYQSDHGGAMPEKLTDLVPKYLPAGGLYYEFRNGPAPAPKPTMIDPEGEEPSYLLTKKLLGTAASRGDMVENPVLVFQRPGQGWVSLVAGLNTSGETGLIGEEEAARWLATLKPNKK